MAWRVLQGDCRQKLRELPDGSVHCVVTSPPYFGLRSYLPDGHELKPFELGGERTPEEYVEHMVEVFHEVRRVLRDDGTLWLVLGDSYCTIPHGPKCSNSADRKLPQRESHGGQQNRKALPGLKHKDLIGIPWRVAFALQANSWWLRADIIYAKPNPMPESVTDRPTRAHEYVFLLTKSARYYYDAEAIREPGREWLGQAGTFKREAGKATTLAVPGQNRPSHRADRDDRVSAGRNKRSVWTIATRPFPGEHYATFPPELVEPCILAGTSAAGCCPKCGAPWVRVVRVEGASTSQRRKQLGYGGKRGRGSGKIRQSLDYAGYHESNIRPRETLGWHPTCSCDAGDPVPCTVLDPFWGVGTTSLVAEQLERDSIGIELNPDYIELGRQRMQAVAHVQRRLWV